MANATSVLLFARYFFGETFQVGFLYTLFGYDVYVGEVLLTFIALVLVALLCMNMKKIASTLMVVLAVVIVLSITVCFFTGAGGVQGDPHAFEPFFVPDENIFMQVITIACISPWAFIGFESISQSTEEFSFPRDRSFKVLASSIVVVTLLYIFVILLSVTAYPPQFNSWFDYISNLGSLQGIEPSLVSMPLNTI